jgi:hypothetical protein
VTRYRHKAFGLLILGRYLKLGAHGIGGNRAEVEDADWGAGVDWLGTELLVGVAQNAADRLWVTNLAARVQIVLARQDLVWAELAKVLRLHHLAGDQASGRHITLEGLGRYGGTGQVALVTSARRARWGVAQWEAGQGGAGETAGLGGEQQKKNNCDQEKNCQSLAIHIINSYR